MICDRGVSHELVRHRIASYSQESTRYVRYGKTADGITFIEPCFLDPKSPGYSAWKVACQFAEIQYQAMLDNGCTPQEARAVLPNSLKTEVVVTMNLRAWRHFFTLRLDRAAHPQAREVAKLALDLLSEHIPVVFDEFKSKEDTA
jgi:thymidylate synthase (FAD)